MSKRPFIPLHKYREPPRPVATFGDLLGGAQKWGWLYCNSLNCGHRVALALGPFAIRWGLDALAVPTIRRKFRCTWCGEKTSSLSLPSYDVTISEVLPFPTEHCLNVLPDHGWLETMCNLYSINKTREEILQLVKALRDLNNNQPPLPGVYPDYEAPIVRLENGERIIANARWGLPSPAFALKGLNSDSGITNVRNSASSHWKRWLGPPNRCLVPLTSFAEPETMPDGKKQNAWFALDESRPIAFFAGVWVPQWKSVRKVKEGKTTNDLYAFLTTDPNKEVSAIHPKAMPAILTKPDEWDMWLNADWATASKLQRPLPDGTLTIIAHGGKSD